MQQPDARPIEGSRHDYPSEATTPTRTGDDLPASDVTKREVKTMYAAPAIFFIIAVGVAVVLALVLLLLHH